MNEKVYCGFARVFFWKSKRLALKNIQRESNENLTKFNISVLDERYRMFNEKFNYCERMYLDRGKVFFRFSCIILFNKYTNG